MLGKVSIYAEAEEEASRYMWIESEKAGQDPGEEAIRQWVWQHWWGLLRSRWLGHLRGKWFWVEVARGDFGLLQRQFKENALLLDRVLDRLEAGRQNLDVLVWVAEWGIPAGPVLEILAAVDVHGRRLAYRLLHPDAPAVTLDPAWLAWNDGTVVRLARGIRENHAFDRLPVLGDALEEAGCRDDAVLGHCRSGGPDSRSSWLVDLIVWGS